MEQQHDIIIVGIQPWDIEIGSNCKNMALELSKKNRVLYVNPALDIITAYKGKQNPAVRKRLEVIKGKLNWLNKVNENLWEFNPPVLLNSINWLPNALFPIANRRNNYLFAKAIKAVIAELNLKNFIVINDSDMFRSFYLKDYLQPLKYIYYTRDNLMTVPYWSKHGKKHEPSLMRKSDLILGNSTHLISYAKQYNNNSFYIGQGCDLSMFSESDVNFKPKDISNIYSTIIGYTGLLTGRRLDIALIQHIAKTRLDWNIVLIGPEEEDFKKSDLHNLPNVHFLGNKSPEDLPLYIQHFDICINPQIVNDLTLSNYPRKIDEYLAMGKPVVATDTPTMEIFKDCVYLAKSKQMFVELIEVAINENSAEFIKMRKDLANSHSWEECINKLWDAFANTK